jgi:hypothetical protein
MLKKLQQFRKLQSVFMPGLSPQDEQQGVYLQPEDEPLRLPSSLISSLLPIACAAHLVDAEARLRLADSYDALEDLRRTLRTRTWLNHFKIQNITGVAPNTRARAMQKAVDQHAAAHARRYRRSRAAHLALQGPGEWEVVLRPLHDEDVRGMNERAMTLQERSERDRMKQVAAMSSQPLDEDDQVEGVGGVVEGNNAMTGEGRRSVRVSWIWLDGSSVENEADPRMRDGKCS